MRSPAERLRDVLEAIERIERYRQRGRAAFEQDELIQSWFLRHIQIIGEAARAVPEDVRQRVSKVPWREIIGMRHILVHNYFAIDLDAVWEVVNEDIQKLRPAIEEALADMVEPP